MSIANRPHFIRPDDWACAKCGDPCSTTAEVETGNKQVAYLGVEQWCYCYNCNASTFHPGRKPPAMELLGEMYNELHCLVFYQVRGSVTFQEEIFAAVVIDRFAMFVEAWNPECRGALSLVDYIKWRVRREVSKELSRRRRDARREQQENLDESGNSTLHNVCCRASCNYDEFLDLVSQHPDTQCRELLILRFQQEHTMSEIGARYSRSAQWASEKLSSAIADLKRRLKVSQ